jgi:elongation factor P
MASTTADLKNGMVLRYNGELCQVIEREHYKPGKGGAFVRLKLKNLRTGSVTEDRMNSGKAIDIVRMESRAMQYLYRDGNHFVFMDNETFEQIPVDETMIGDRAQFLKENETANLIYSTDDNQLVNVELPTFVILEVTETEMAVRGDTATDVTKPATLETGAEISVPSFIEQGDRLKIDTRTGTYIERSKE